MSKTDPKTTPNLGSSLGELKMKGWTDYLIIIRERWLVALTLAIALPNLYLYYQIQQPRIFAASAFLIVEPSAGQIVNIEQVVNLNTLDEAVMQVHESQLRSNVFSQNVFYSFSAKERQGLLKPYREEWEIEAVKETVSNVARVISKGLNIERFERKYTFVIQMRPRDPAMAALVAKQYVDQYQDYLVERAKRSNLKAITNTTQDRTVTPWPTCNQSSGSIAPISIHCQQQ